MHEASDEGGDVKWCNAVSEDTEALEEGSVAER
jgi:hypothetical protein